ncbi:MAG: DEAD/DEAH box helicase [Candidatus Thiodiazotropha sp.]|nr:DEAD/DEAH box helicase [Candidatus Thiodiazotropha sp.]MCM8920632.1 DEAD/DEAH box helicase [Candidatus Thiodiazotropha sp.]
MIPGLLAQSVADSLREFITTGYETDSWPFSGKFEQLVKGDGTPENQGEAFIKGPYVSINLPYQKTTDRRDLFSAFKTQYSPFTHQEKAWNRLRSDLDPQSAIIATGTGSGKTECFMFPLLDHCLRSAGPGIKAIVIYPMNALAGDQAKRFADTIYRTPELKNKIRIGLFVGGAETTDKKAMGPEQVITCKETLRKHPPDILLTNYKMLDYLLIRPKDYKLWAHNQAETLRYLVVDELHTFDGAQGADLAMLIRRLKARLQVPKNHLICAGTSATLGSEAQKGDLANYAQGIFDTRFDAHSGIIGESREAQDQFLKMIEHMMLDPSYAPEQLSSVHYRSFEEYLSAQVRLFFGEECQGDVDDTAFRQHLGECLKQHLIVHNVLHLTQKGPVTIQGLIPALQKQLPAPLRRYATDVLLSLLSLMSHARSQRNPKEAFVTVRLQLWTRELRRIVASVGDDSAAYPVTLHFSDDLKRTEEKLYLPLVQCTECHATSWITRVEDGGSHVEDDLRSIYNAFFGNDKQTTLLLPLRGDQTPPEGKGLVRHMCLACGHLQSTDGPCSACLEQHLVRVFQPDLNKRVKRGGVPTLESQRKCPVCQANKSLILFGARVASLSAVAIHQLYANHFNDDKKLIAFSDSVQDAAHHAGFFAARTWQNNVRMAIAKAIHAGSEKVPIQQLYESVPGYWLNNPVNPQRMEVLNYITQFIAPNMQANGDYITLKDTGALRNPTNLLGQVNKRLVWEMLQEFSTRSMIGRSLERTGSACLGWEPERVNRAAETLTDSAREQLGCTLSDSQARFMLWGLLLRMKRQGAVYHPQLKTYIESGAEWFLISRKNISYMPNLGNYSILPRFPAEAAEKGLEPIFPKGERGWYLRWLTQLLGADELVDDHFVRDLLMLILNTLQDQQIVSAIDTRKGHKVWALNPEILFVYSSLAVLHLELDKGEEARNENLGSLYVPADWVSQLEGMPSLDQFGTGQVSYAKSLTSRHSFYRNFYLQGEINRVIAHEHTALLERIYREELESDFIKGRKPWDVNLLSATPTLEMGIDIGDLSSVLLCSMPPSQANYLQRAGRAGRKDGNSLVLTLANGQPHDLYFYADPLKMLAGEVEAPAIFLNASMVLKRQLLAFCFDHWGVTLKGGQAIPVRMQPVLDAVHNHDLKKFPYTLIEYIKLNRDVIWEKFSSILDAQISAESLQRLRSFLIGVGNESSIEIYLLEKLKELVDVRRTFEKQQKDLESEKKTLEKKPTDEAVKAQLEELERELQGIKRLKYDLNRKETLNFFTDEGLLPNYAFPEEGTTLHSVIYRKLREPRETDDGKLTNYDSKVFEYARPARSALSELAPESLFYANSRRVQIERIEMARGENLEYWRLCPSCSHSRQIIGSDQDATCPRCGDPMWANVSQLKPMVRLKQVYANTREDDALIGDDSDTREPIFFNRQMLIDFDSPDITLAYEMKTDTRPFGFEFIRKATFREINFGKQGGSDQTFHVAGSELPRPGFRLCKECGTVQHRKSKPEHLFKCRYKNAEGNEGIIDCLYLYREYDSEAIRILMPHLSVATQEEQIDSFVAALQLGLKKRFGGQVNHIHITNSDEPIPGSTERANYLVLYDSVPGGTGYLHDLLADPKHLMEMLTMSRNHMAACGCQQIPEQDGCYNCLYAYRNSYGMEHTSRVTALKMLEDVLDQNVPLEKVSHLGKIKKDHWSDSELEARLPDALQMFHQHPALGNIRVRTSKDVIAGKVGFRLEVGENDYSVEIHPRLSQKDGVLYPCEPDFLIRSDRLSDNFRPVAVFLDGYRYHKHIVQQDLLKRQGISLSRKYYTWSLTWYDVNMAFAGNETKIPNVLREHTDGSHKAALRQLAAHHDLSEHEAIAEQPPLVMLLRYLKQPSLAHWERFAVLRALHWFDQKTMQSREVITNFNDRSLTWPVQFTDQWREETILVAGQQDFGNTNAEVLVSLCGTADAVKQLSADDLILSVEYSSLDPDSPDALKGWQRLLQLLNVGQFIHHFFAATKEGLEEGSFTQLAWVSDMSQAVEFGAWDKIAELSDEELGGWLGIAANAGIPLPYVGYEYVSKSGAVLAEAELAWIDSKAVLLLEYQMEDNRSEFENHGWVVFDMESDMELIKKTLGAE